MHCVADHHKYCDMQIPCKQTVTVQERLGVIRPDLDGRSKMSSVGKKNKTGFFTGDHTDSKPSSSINTVCSNVCPVIRDVSFEENNRMHIRDLDEAFDRNCFLNSCDNIGRTQCMVGVDNKSKRDSSVTQKHQFGFLPLDTLQLYNGDPIYYETILDIMSTHLMARVSGVPNFLKCHVPVKSKLNVDRWHFHLLDYWDQHLPDLLEYGFPIDFDRSSPLLTTFVNHTFAHGLNYLTEELQHQAIMGPFVKLPFPIHISPLMTRDKQDSLQKRTIMDLSWPKDLSVNYGVDKDKYLHTPYLLNYPSIDNITASLCKLGPEAQLFKIDTSRAFRQIKVDPGDIDLLGLQFDNNYFINLSVPFGYRHGSKIFQRCTDSIRHIMAKHGFPGLYNFIDDLIFTGLPSKIYLAYEFLQNLLSD